MMNKSNNKRIYENNQEFLIRNMAIVYIVFVASSQVCEVALKMLQGTHTNAIKDIVKRNVFMCFT